MLHVGAPHGIRPVGAAALLPAGAPAGAAGQGVPASPSGPGRIDDRPAAADPRRTRRGAPKSAYDVVIIGGGVHGLAIAYELAKRGVKNVAVLEASYLGSGASHRNTAIIRSNYRTSQGVAFYDESVKLYERLSVELGFNVLFSQHGHLTLAHTELGDRRSARARRDEPAHGRRLAGHLSRTRSGSSRRPSTCRSKPRFPILAAL